MSSNVAVMAPDKSPIRLAVLDMAGTTVEDAGAVQAAFLKALTGIGEDPHQHAHAVETMMGQSKISVFRALLGDTARAVEANQRFERAYRRAIKAGGCRPIDGAEETISQLRASGVKVCLATGFSPATRDLLIASLGWASVIDLALSPGPGIRGRPFPDLVLAAVLRLEVDAVSQVAVVGDTVNDLWCGWRAGAGIVAGVLTGAHGEAELSGAPHTHVLGSVVELPGAIARRPCRHHRGWFSRAHPALAGPPC